MIRMSTAAVTVAAISASFPYASFAQEKGPASLTDSDTSRAAPGDEAEQRLALFLLSTGRHGVVPFEMKIYNVDEIIERFGMWRQQAIESTRQIGRQFRDGRLSDDTYLAARWKYAKMASAANALIDRLITDINASNTIVVFSYASSIDNVETAAHDFFQFYETRILSESQIILPQIAAIATIVATTILLIDHFEIWSASSKEERQGGNCI